MKIQHLIDNHYQVVDETTNTIMFQSTYEACAHYLYDYETSMKTPTIDELTQRIDKLEQEVEWTREMVDILQEYIDNMKSSDY